MAPLERKSRIVSFRLSEQEYRLLEQQAEGPNFSALVRAGIRMMNESKPVPSKDAATRTSLNDLLPLYAIRGWTPQLQSALKQIGSTDLPVLIAGETGVGKDALCQAIHDASAYETAPLVRVNCVGLTPATMASRFTTAAGGSLVIRDIHLADPALQATLLDLIDGQPAGAVRLLATSHLNLEREARAGHFNPELLYRINVVHIELLPLRERPQDILPLARHFLSSHGNSLSLPPTLEHAFIHYHWPGNIRELDNLMKQYSVVRDPDALLSRLAIPNGTVTLSHPDSEHDRILATLESTRWHRKQTAALLGIGYKTLLYRMKKLGIGVLPEHPTITP